MDCSPPGSSVHRDSPGKNTGMGCHALLQGIFPTQGLNPGLPHCRQIAYHLSHQGSILLLLTHLTLQPYFVDIIIIFIILQIMKLKHNFKGNSWALKNECDFYSDILGFPGGSDGKESACNTGDLSSIPGSGRSPGEGNDNPL